MKIGLFDSGLGGLTILKAVTRELPAYDYEYYGDTAHLPYGDRGEREVYELSKRGVGQLFERGCALVVLACNTASAETLRKLQDEWLPEAYPGKTDYSSLSFFHLDAEQGKAQFIDSYPFKGILPECVQFDKSGQSIIAATYDHHGNKQGKSSLDFCGVFDD